MLNILFWMILIFISAVVLITAWVREAEERQVATSTLGEETLFDQAKQRTVSSETTSEPAALFHTIPATQTTAKSNKRLVSKQEALQLYIPKEETACEVFDLSGNRVA